MHAWCLQQIKILCHSTNITLNVFLKPLFFQSSSTFCVVDDIDIFTEDFNKRSLVPELEEDDKKGLFKEVAYHLNSHLYQTYLYHYNCNEHRH